MIIWVLRSILSFITGRSDAPFFERQREGVLRAAREGAVVVSAFNREVCLVMNELARVIAGVGDGWWK